MTVIIKRRDPDTDALNDIGRIDNGEIVEGRDMLADLFVDGEIPAEDALLERFRGPTLFAGRGSSTSAAEGRLAVPLGDVPIIPDGKERLNKDDLILYALWVRQGRPTAENFDPAAEVEVAGVSLEGRSFNPSLHPRGPDGKFVERSWDVPDTLELESLRRTPTLALLEELEDAGEPVDDILADDSVRIDGIPDDANSLDEAATAMGGDGVAFQDLELNDEVEIVADDGQLYAGTVAKTEQVDGGPNRAEIITDTGTNIVADVPEGVAIRRPTETALPPTEAAKKDPLTKADIQPGDQVLVTSGYQDQAGGVSVDAVGKASFIDDLGVDSQEILAVDGDQYDADHPNIQVFDASAETLSADDVEEGDVVAAFTGVADTKIAEGEVTDTTEVEANSYATIQDQAADEDVQVNLDTHTIKKPGTIPDSEDVTAANTADGAAADATLDEPDGAGESAVEITPGDGIGDYLEATAPEDVSVDDVEGYLVSINPQEVAPDDWVAWADTWDGDVDNIGHVSDVSTDNLNMLVDQDGSIEDTPTAQDKLHRVVTDTDTSKIAPGSIDPADVSVSGTAEVTGPSGDGLNVSDVQEGDFVSIQKGMETKVGRVEDAESSAHGSVIVDPGGGEETESVSTLSDSEIRLIDDAAVVQAGSEDAPIKFQSTEADAIDPSSVSATALSSDQTAEYDFAAGQEGDWITYEDEDGNRHAGIVNKPAPSTLNVKTGHSSDPQKVLDTDSVRGIDQSAVTDIGSPAGASKTTTGSTPTPSSDFSVDGLEDNPNVDVGDVTEDDLQRGVVTEEDGSIGVLDGDTVQAFQEFMADPDQGGQDILTALSTNTTSGSGLSFPRNDWMLVRDHVAHFATEVDGITAPNANARANDLLSKIDIWKGKSYNDNGQTIERFFHGGVDLPGDFRDDGLDGDDPDDSGAAVAALMTAATQGFLRENWTDIETHDVFGRDSDEADGERSMYRGIGRTAISTLAKDWASEPTADAHTVKESKVTNWTTDSGVADSFSTDGHQLKKNSTVEDAIFSPDMMTGEKTGIDTEAEIWFTGGVSEAPPENIRVTSDGSLTMADMNTPGDMGDDQLEVTYNWANRMLQKEINLESETQIDTYRSVLERMKEAGFTHYKRQKVEELIDRSVIALKNADGPGAVTAD